MKKLPVDYRPELVNALRTIDWFACGNYPHMDVNPRHFIMMSLGRLIYVKLF